MIVARCTYFQPAHTVPSLHNHVYHCQSKLMLRADLRSLSLRTSHMSSQCFRLAMYSCMSHNRTCSREHPPTHPSIHTCTRAHTHTPVHTHTHIHTLTHSHCATSHPPTDTHAPLQSLAHTLLPTFSARCPAATHPSGLCLQDAPHAPSPASPVTYTPSNTLVARSTRLQRLGPEQPPMQRAWHDHQAKRSRLVATCAASRGSTVSP